MSAVKNTNVVNAGSTSNASDTEEKLLLPLPKWKIWYIMVVIFILLFFDLATRSVVGPLFPLIKKEFGLLDYQLGLLSTVTMGTVMILAIPLSYLIDRWRRGKMMSLMAILWSVASIISGLANGFAMLLTGRAVLGVAEASYNSAGQTMIMATIKKRLRTTITGFLYTGMTLGMAGGLVLGGWLGASYGWRNTLIILAIPGIIFGIIAWFMPDYKNLPRPAGGPSETSSKGFGEMIKSFLINKSVMLMVIAYAFILFIIYTIVSWLPTYLIRFAGMDVSTAGTMSGLVILIGLFAMPLGGWLGDLAARKSARAKITVILSSAIIAVVGAICALLFNVWPLFIFTSIGVNLLIPAQQVTLQELVPSHQRASVFGFYYTGTLILGGLWAPFAIGAISDASDLKIAFWVGVGIATISVILYPLVYKFFNNDYARARQQEQ